MIEKRLPTKKELKKLFTNLNRKGITDEMMGLLIEVLWRDKTSSRTSGFYWPGAPDMIMTFDDATRTLTITPRPPDDPASEYIPHFRFFTWSSRPVFHRRYTAETIVIPNEEGLYLIYYDIDDTSRFPALQYFKNPDVYTTSGIYIAKTIIAAVYWNSDAGQAMYLGDLRHGSEWPTAIHWWVHETLNSQRQDGIAIQDISVNGTGNDAIDFQFGISAGTLWHEDIFDETPQVRPAEALPVWYFDANGLPRYIHQEYKKIINTGSGLLAYNIPGIGIAEASDLSYVIYHYFATNCMIQPHIAVMGQKKYNSLSAASAAIESEVIHLKDNLPHSNLMHIASLIFQTSKNFTNSAKAKLIVANDGSVTNIINNYIEVNNQELLPAVIRNGVAEFKESFLTDDAASDTYTQLSSWYVTQPNELVGNFKAVVMVHDKITHEIFSLQNILTFDYTDGLNQVKQDTAIIVAAPISLALDIDLNNQLYAQLTTMHSTNAKRIHFCFERCITQSLMLDLAGTISMQLGTTGELELLLELEGTSDMNLVMNGTFADEWELFTEFTIDVEGTVGSNSDHYLSANPQGLIKWNIGGTEIYDTEFSVAVSGPTTVKLYGKSDTLIQSITGQQLGISGILDLSDVKFSQYASIQMGWQPITQYILPDNIILANLDVASTDITTLDLTNIGDLSSGYSGTIISARECNLLTSILFPSQLEGKLGTFNIDNANITGTLDLSMIKRFANRATFYMRNNPNLTQIIFCNNLLEGSIRNFIASGCNITGTLDLSNLSFDLLFLDLSQNSNLTETLFDNITGTIKNLYLSNCNIIGPVDFSSLPLTTDSTIRYSGNALLNYGIFNDNQIIKEINFSSCEITGTLDISKAIFEYLYVSNNPINTIILSPNLTGPFTINVSNTNIRYIDFTNYPNCTNKNQIQISFANNNLSEAEIDRLLVEIDSISTDGYYYRYLHFQNCAAPTDGTITGYNGILARDSLLAKGFTIY